MAVIVNELRFRDRCNESYFWIYGSFADFVASAALYDPGCADFVEGATLWEPRNADFIAHITLWEPRSAEFVAGTTLGKPRSADFVANAIQHLMNLEKK